MKLAHLVLTAALILGGVMADAADCRLIVPGQLAAVRDIRGARVLDVLKSAAGKMKYKVEVIRGLTTTNGGFIELKVAPGRKGEAEAAEIVNRIESLNQVAKRGIIFMLGTTEVADSDDLDLIHAELTAAQVESLAAESQEFMDEEVLVLGEVTTRTDVDTGILIYSAKESEGGRSASRTQIAPADQLARGLSQVLPTCQ